MSDTMSAEYEALQIEWHCLNRHGVVRDVPVAEAGRVQQVIEWHQGAGACFWTKAEGGRQSVEFVAMTKVHPAPSKPWQWCGTAVLWADWQARAQATEALARTFVEADVVTFEYRGVTKTALVMYPNEKTVSVLVANEGRYRVPPSQLRKVGP